MIERGMVFTADLREGGRHPIIVVSRQELNRGRYVLAVVCTSAHFEIRSKLANCVPFAPASSDLRATALLSVKIFCRSTKLPLIQTLHKRFLTIRHCATSFARLAM